MEFSKEEKKAIETLETEGTENNFLEVRILLNLVDKQQKEIEEKTTIIMAGAEKVKQLEKEVEELNLDLEEMTKSNNHKKENWVHKNILNSYISKDKIREKIKELEITRNSCITDNGFTIMSVVISNLKELLEEN